jgi:hypothetical protein
MLVGLMVIDAELGKENNSLIPYNYDRRKLELYDVITDLWTRFNYGENKKSTT